MSSSAIPFPTSGVPIVGEPCAVETWTGTFLFICKNCNPHRHVLVPGPTPLAGVCQGCGRIYEVTGLIAPFGQPAQFQINIKMPVPPPGTEAKPS